MPPVNRLSYKTQRSKTNTIANKHITTVKSDPCDLSTVTWSNLQARYRELLVYKDTPQIDFSSVAARKAHSQRIKSVLITLLDRGQRQCHRLLVSGDANSAEAAGIVVLKLREQYYGANSMQLVPSYLHLARARQFMQRYGEAQDMLSLAHFIVLKHQDNASVAMKAEMHQAFGLLYAADNKLDAAVNHLTYTVYYLSCQHGPQHVLTTFSFFDLANVFAAKANVQSAMALYDCIKQIWFTFLNHVLSDALLEKVEKENQKKYADDDDVRVEPGYTSTRQFGADNLSDASKMLYGIHQIQQERFQITHPSPTRAKFVLGLFLLWVDDLAQAGEHLRVSRLSSQELYGPRHPIVEEIQYWCTRFDVPYETEEDANISHTD